MSIAASHRVSKELAGPAFFQIEGVQERASS
jgi:hypothetical protein